MLDDGTLLAVHSQRLVRLLGVGSCRHFHSKHGAVAIAGIHGNAEGNELK